MTAPSPPVYDDAPFVGTTDEPAQFAVPASLDGVHWSAAVAAPGGTVALSARAAHVGTGAPCIVEVVEEGGATVWEGEGAFVRGWFHCEVEIPSTLTPGCRTLVGRVRLPEHDLGADASLSIEPLAEVAEAAWSAAEVQAGGTVSMLADVRGTSESAVAIEVFRQGPSGLAIAVGEPFAAPLAGGRLDVEWAVPEVSGLALPSPEQAEGDVAPPSPVLVYRLHVGQVTADSSPLRVVLPQDTVSS